jgi:hypothetical protein
MPKTEKTYMLFLGFIWLCNELYDGLCNELYDGLGINVDIV